MNRHNWRILKFGIKQGLIRDIEDQNNPLNFKIDQYLEGKINLRCILLGVMHDLENNNRLGSTRYYKKDIRFIDKKVRRDVDEI